MNKFNNRLFENLLHTNDLLSNKDEIPIHFLVVYGGYLCTIFTCCFCIIVGTSLPKTYDENQLFYISEGFQRYCGWSIVVLGTCTGITLFTQLISAIHMN